MTGIDSPELSPARTPGDDVTRHWPRVLVAGVLDVIVGVLALALPGLTVLGLAVLLGVILLISGVWSIGFGTRLLGAHRSSALWSIVLGVLAVLAGVICLVHPGTALIVIATTVAIWFLFAGAIDVHRATVAADHRVWWAVLGVASLLAGVVLLVDVTAALLTVATIIGVSFLVRAGAELAVALRLRRAHTAVKGGRR